MLTARYVAYDHHKKDFVVPVAIMPSTIAWILPDGDDAKIMCVDGSRFIVKGPMEAVITVAEAALNS